MAAIFCVAFLAGCGGSNETTGEANSPPLVALTKQEARSTIEDFYSLTDEGLFGPAWRTLTPSAQSEIGTLADWSSGHETRTRTDLRDVWIEPISRTVALAHIDLRTIDGSSCGIDSTQFFKGTWTIQERHSDFWISDPNVSLIRGEDPLEAEDTCTDLRLARKEARQEAREARLAVAGQAADEDYYYSGGDDYGSDDYEIDPTPETIDGSPSYEFEQDDIDRAEEASPEVQEYCSGAVSEAQYVGCLSHVDEWDIP